MEVGRLRDRAGLGANVEHWASHYMMGKLKGPGSLYAALHHSFQYGGGVGKSTDKVEGKYVGGAGKGSSQLETSPIYLLLMDMEKEGRILIVEVRKRIGDSPCLWSVPRKQDNAPCPGLIGSRSAPS